jgi:tRNA A58 N-methylase Trm61
LTQNQLIELFETEQLKAIVERSEERGWVDPAELEGFVTEQELASEEVEHVTRELEAMWLDIGAPFDSLE